MIFVLYESLYAHDRNHSFASWKISIAHSSLHLCPYHVGIAHKVSHGWRLSYSMEGFEALSKLLDAYIYCFIDLWFIGGLSGYVISTNQTDTATQVGGQKIDMEQENLRSHLGGKDNIF